MSKLSLEYSVVDINGNIESAALCSEGNEHLVIERIKRLIERGATLTPSEELHKTLFVHESNLVSNMEDLELYAHIELLQKIAFEANTRFTAAKAEKDRRQTKNKPASFHGSIQTDESTTGAIGAVKTRQEKLTKYDKQHANLVKLGIDPEEATRRLSAGALLELRKRREAKESGSVDNIPQSFNPEKQAAIEATEKERIERESEPKKPFVNPFGKKVVTTESN